MNQFPPHSILFLVSFASFVHISSSSSSSSSSSDKSATIGTLDRAAKTLDATASLEVAAKTLDAAASLELATETREPAASSNLGEASASSSSVDDPSESADLASASNLDEIDESPSTLSLGKDSEADDDPAEIVTAATSSVDDPLSTSSRQTLDPSVPTVMTRDYRDDDDFSSTTEMRDDGGGDAETDVEIEAAPSRKMKMLIFGGNGMLGSEVVEKLLKLPNGADIYLVHRGNWYWDTESTVKPFVSEVFYCDRTRPLRDCAPLYECISSSTTYFDFVIDFSALVPAVIEDALRLLKRTYVGLYIYISSDSVYEVCVKKERSSWSGEEDAVRPADPDQAKRLNALDSYGDGKLGCEESLTRFRSFGGPPFVSLRLPDVLGPRDNTNRFWMTHILVNLHTFLTKSLRVPKDDYKMSFVYSRDVASLIYSMVVSADPLSFADSAFNVAWPRPVSFHEFYSTVAASLPIGRPFKLERAREGDEDDGRKLHFYPSVAAGPINVTKLTTTFGWEPTDWTKAIFTVIEFYKEASTKFPLNFKRALRGLNGKLDDETLKKASFGVYAVELSSGGCIDLHPKCALWAVTGECDRNPRWMKPNCMESCHTCHLLDKAREKSSRPKDEL